MKICVLKDKEVLVESVEVVGGEAYIGSILATLRKLSLGLEGRLDALETEYIFTDDDLEEELYTARIYQRRGGYLFEIFELKEGVTAEKLAAR